MSGGYSDWLRQRPATPIPASTSKPQAPEPPKAHAAAPPARAKLSYKEARELEQLPQRIEALEAQVAGFTARMGDSGYFQREAAAIAADNAALASAQAALDAAYGRWEQLEGG